MIFREKKATIMFLNYDFILCFLLYHTEKPDATDTHLANGNISNIILSYKNCQLYCHQFVMQSCN